MSGRRLASIRRIVSLASVFFWLQLAPVVAEAPIDKIIIPSNSDVITQIVACLAKGQEVVLQVAKVECTRYLSGAKIFAGEVVELDTGAPYTYDVTEVCNPANAGKDFRWLPGDAIKRIAAAQNPKVSSSGIRILGAVFCNFVDLVGLDLPYSLIIDRSFFGAGIEARNFRTSGDFSFDESVSNSTITLARSHIGGTVYGSESRIRKLQIFDSGNSRLADFPQFGISRPGRIRHRGAIGRIECAPVGAFLFFPAIQQGEWRPRPHRKPVEVRRQICKSEIGDLVAVDSGFGIGVRTGNGADLFDWRDDGNFGRSIRAVNASFHSAGTTVADKCDYSNLAKPGNFLVSDTTVRSSFCMRSFHWLSQSKKNAGRIKSYVRFNDLTVGATMFIDFTRPVKKSEDETHTFDAIGMKTRSLIFDFNGDKQVDRTSTSGLAFDDVYAAGADIECKYELDLYATPKPYSVEWIEKPRNVENIENLRSQLRLPKVIEVMNWLNNNCMQTTQPFSAFVDAAQRTGNDSDAKQLRIARASKELWLRITRLINGHIETSTCDDETAPAVPNTSASGTGSSDFFQYVGDVVTVIFGSLLAILADHGYRPEKVGWFVAAVLVLSLIYFWAWLRIVAFMPAKRNVVRPIGLLFLFDRVLPAYRICEEHYQIKSFYRILYWPWWPPGTLPPQRGRNAPKTLEYLRLKFPVVKATPAEAARVETALDIIKVIGLVFAIFLVAAINALVSR